MLGHYLRVRRPVRLLGSLHELREHLGLGAGTEVEVVAVDGGALVRPASGPHSRGQALVAALRDRADAGLHANDILRMTRGSK
jgi:bifunctional DNA-binding transcriptional regulator/antitoxin component of YhaV-PrlF toxin-antitoxin module